MPNEQRIANQRDQFAVAMAMGQSISAWAKKNGVPSQTCHEWKDTEEFKLRVQHIRRRTIDRAAGQLVHDLTKAVGRIARLATKGKTEYVRLQAARAVLKEAIVFRRHFDLEEQVAELESDFKRRESEYP